MVATCRSSHDLAQHLSARLATEATDGGLSSPSRVAALTHQVQTLQEEFQQLEMLAKTRETNLREERYLR